MVMSFALADRADIAIESNAAATSRQNIVADGPSRLVEIPKCKKKLIVLH